MTPLDAEIRRIIATDGPISVADYMRLCLGHPQHGYYLTRDPLGARGDFITAPEVSQMFGELIGAWAATVWRQMGAPAPINLIELGPGRGTLMADALRAAKTVPEFAASLSVHLVETSPALRAAQQAKLGAANWHARIEDVPEGPCIAIANEFVDALPVDQLVQDRGWHMRMIGIVGDRLGFVVSPDALPGPTGIAAPAGAILELRHDQPVAILARRIARDGGAALIVDYGHATTGFGDTLQAMRAHRYADPLAGPGEADLTTQVDFAALARTARREGADVHGPITQGDFLRRLGIEARAARLKQNATPQQSADIDAALARLTASDQMGELFKVLAIADPTLDALPGFEAAPP